MEKRLATFRERFGTGRAVVFFLVVYLITQATIGSILHPLGALDFIRAQTTYAPETFLAYLSRWADQGLMERYRFHFWFDFVLPFWYAFLLGSMLSHGLNRNALSPRWNWVLPAPLVAGLMDLTENAFHLFFLADLSAVSRPLIALSATAAITKWALAAGSLLTASVLYARAGFTRSALHETH